MAQFTEAGSVYYSPGKRYTKAEEEVLELILADRKEQEEAALRAVRNFEKVSCGRGQ